MPKNLQLKLNLNLEGVIDGLKNLSARFISGMRAGLYIGENRITLVAAEIAMGKVKSVVEKAVEFSKDDAPPDKLKELFAQLDTRPQWLSLALPDEDAVVRFLRMPRIPRNEWEQAITFESKKFIPFEEKDVSLYYKVILPKGDLSTMNVVLVAAKKSSIERVISITEKAGIRVNAVEVASFSLIRFYRFSAQLDKEASTAIVHIGADKVMSIIVVKSGIPYLTRDISLKDKDAAAAESVIGEIRGTSIYYSRQFPKQFIGKIILCGEADFAGWDDAISGQLNIPVVVGDIIKDAYKIPSRSAVAFGSALRGIVRMDAEPQFALRAALPKPSLPLPIGEINRPVIIKVAVIEAIIFALISFGIFNIANRDARRLRAKLNEIYAGRPAIPEAYYKMDKGPLTIAASSLQKKLFYMKELVDNKAYWSDIAATLARLSPEGVWFNKIMAINTLSEGEMNRPFSRSMVLDGAVYSADTQREMYIVNEFIDKLKKDAAFSKFFTTVELGTVYAEHLYNNMTTKFSLKCYN